jgi:acyl-ACP thioesterase
MFKKKYFIGPNEVDSLYNLKISSFLRMCQEIASLHAEELGIGYQVTSQKNLMWVITRFSIKIHRLPKYQQNIFLETYPGKTVKFIFPRYFVLLDEDGNKLIEASSTWLLLNKESKQISLRPFDFEILSEDRENQINLPIKVELPDNLTLIEQRKVRLSEIDFNSHLNNTKYIEYVLDMHDIEFYKNNIIEEIVINYNHEIKENDIVDLKSNLDNPEYIEGSIQEFNCFNVLISYKK